MNPELSSVDKDKAVSPFAQEIEYALTLQRMITRLTEDPEKLSRTSVIAFSPRGLRSGSLAERQLEHRHPRAILTRMPRILAASRR